jgi:hypothetical protein
MDADFLPDFLHEAGTWVGTLGAAFEADCGRLDGLRKRLRVERCHLAVLGQFKRGKSTLVNALLGAPVLARGKGDRSNLCEAPSGPFRQIGPVPFSDHMEHRWVREAVAKKLVAESDSQRRRFYEGYFGRDWSNPLEYHITVNSGRPGPTALDLVTLAAVRHWRRGKEPSQ